MTALLSPSLAIAQQSSALAGDIQKIRDEGMNRSQAMATMKYLSDVIGSRLTNSPAQLRANRWTKDRLEKWGMKNAVIDPWGEFGKGWELKRFSAVVKLPEQTMFLRAYPKAWSPSTNGAITGNVVVVDAQNEEELTAYKGKLKGAIVLIASEQNIKPNFEPLATRVSDENLAKFEESKAEAAIRSQRPTPPANFAEQMRFNARKYRFYFEEGAAVLIDAGNNVDAGTIRVMGASPAPPAEGTTPSRAMRVYSKDAPPTIPQLATESEQYNRLLRLVRQGIPVQMTVDIDAQFYTNDLQGYNTIAEIPGTDLKDEVVMIGGHLDSWHSGSGSTDNGAGTTVAMEAMRILAASGLKPRRTIRVGLWTGEEQGLLGSRGYVSKYIASTSEPSSPEARPAITKMPLYDKFSAYYNLDNGTGQIRGIYMQGNEALRPVFKDWLTPFTDIGAKTVTVQSTGGTDHLAFDAVGIPGFQFIQDPIEYFGRTWHTTQDVADRTIEEDLKRSAVIMAAFAYNTAMLNDKLPRKSQTVALNSIIPELNFIAQAEDRAFKKSGYNFSICGHEIEHDEIPIDFPAILTVGNKHDHNAE